MDENNATYAALHKRATDLRAAGAGEEAILEELRRLSPSIIQSMKVVRDVFAIPMSEAKRLVHRSRAWSDMRDTFSEIQEAAEQEYEKDSRDTGPNERQVSIDLDETDDGSKG